MSYFKLPKMKPEEFDKMCYTDNSYLNIAIIDNYDIQQIQSGDNIAFDNSDKIYFEILEVMELENIVKIRVPLTIFTANSSETKANPTNHLLVKVKVRTIKMKLSRKQQMDRLIAEYASFIEEGYLPLQNPKSEEHKQTEELLKELWMLQGKFKQSLLTDEVVERTI